MKKIIKLTETELKNIVKKTINELDRITIPPSYTLQITNDGNLSVISSGKIYKYALYKVTMLKDLKLTVLDFPTQNEVEVSVFGVTRRLKLNKNKIAEFIKNNLGKKEMEITLGDHTLKFVRV